MIDAIMLFAAGRGSRLGSLTKDIPKPLIEISNKPILHYALDMCKIHGFKKIIINTHYLHNKIEDAISNYKLKNPQMAEKIITIHEKELLETGGAIKNVYELFDKEPIFALNTDVILKADYDLFESMEQKWNPDKMDFLLLVQPREDCIGYTGNGDFEIQTNSQLTREISGTSYSFMHAGLVILKPKLIKNNSLKIFSLKDYYLKCHRVFGVKARNIKWYHVTHPEDIKAITEDIEEHRNCG